MKGPNVKQKQSCQILTTPKHPATQTPQHFKSQDMQGNTACIVVLQCALRTLGEGRGSGMFSWCGSLAITPSESKELYPTFLEGFRMQCFINSNPQRATHPKQSGAGAGHSSSHPEPSLVGLGWGGGVTQWVTSAQLNCSDDVARCLSKIRT